jgi:hypothetical protein
MGVLDTDIAAYTGMRKELEAQHLRQWVVFYEGKLEGVFPDYESAAESAVDRFDRGPYLIRQVGAGPIHLGGGMIFRPAYANDPGGV